MPLADRAIGNPKHRLLGTHRGLGRHRLQADVILFLMLYSLLMQPTMQFGARISKEPQNLLKSLGIRPGGEILHPCLSSVNESEKISSRRRAKTIPAREPRYKPAKCAPPFREPVHYPQEL